MHKSYAELGQLLQQASSDVKVGGLYAHYKHPAQLYLVLDLVITEADDKVAVLYCRAGKPEIKFVRPLASWLEEVEDGGKRLPRFSLVESD